eukprot:c21448_g1_i2 orf=295-1233(+)
MSCRGFVKVSLKVINFLFILVGLAMIGYGIYMVVIWASTSSSTTSSPPPPPPSIVTASTFHSPPALSSLKDSNTGDGIAVLQLRRSLLQNHPTLKLTRLASFWSHIPSAWFVYMFIAVGIVITLITCSGYIAAATANGCCLSCYSLFLGLFMILELGIAGFVFFDQDWQEVIPEDSTGELDNIENFIEDKIDILKWVALGAIILQALVLLLAVVLRGMRGNPTEAYDSDDEFLGPRASRQPLLNTSMPSGPSTSVGTGAENRPARNDAWSTRMREKYGLDTAEFSYSPSGANRSSQQQPDKAQERKSCCVIM